MLIDVEGRDLIEHNTSGSTISQSESGKECLQCKTNTFPYNSIVSFTLGITCRVVKCCAAGSNTLMEQVLVDFTGYK